MDKARLEAFSDGVIAILITLMVFDIKPPGDADVSALLSVLPAILTYVLSFLYLGIYWSNHHHLLQLTAAINGRVLWANLHLLFWLALIPFGTSWMHASDFAEIPTAVYGVVLFASSLAWIVLEVALVADRRNAKLHGALGRDLKTKLSAGLYVLAVVIALFRPWIAIALYVLVAGMWLIPDRRLERSVLG